MWHFNNHSENSTCSQEQAVESSAECFSDIPVCVRSRLRGIPDESCLPDNGTGSYHPSPCGTTSAHSTADHGGDRSTSLPVDFLVKTSAQPAKVLDSAEPAPAYGLKWPELYARYDRDTASWKTHPCLFPEDSMLCSVTLPRWGMMHRGVISALPTPAHLTCGKGSGRWPTPRARDMHTEKKLTRGANAGPGGTPLIIAIRERFQTPRASCQDMATMVMSRYSGTDRKAGKPEAQYKPVTELEGMDQSTTGQLNPTWVEWLMGWPLGWTDLRPLATAKYRQWQHSHGVS